MNRVIDACPPVEEDLNYDIDLTGLPETEVEFMTPGAASGFQECGFGVKT
jgi:hypothetical protein